MERRITANKILLILLTLIILFPVAGLSQDSTLVEFEMEDQFDNVYTDKSWPDSIIILIGSDKGGSEFNRLWGKTVSDTLSKQLPGLAVKQVGLADLGSVPFFMTGIVSGMFPENRERWILMDWDGLFAETYHFAEDSSNILIFNQKRNLVYQTAARELEKDKFSEILLLLKSLTTE